MRNKKFWVSLLAGVLAAIMLLSLIISILPTNASAATSSEIKEQIEELEAEFDAQQDRIDELSALQSDNLESIEEIVAQKTLIEEEVGLLYSQVELINEQIAAYNVLIADKQEELDEAQENLDQLNEKYKERIRSMEEDGDISYWSVLFAANSFSDLLDRLNIVQEIAAADSRRLEELRDAAQEVEQMQSALLTEREALDEVKALLAQSQETLAVKSAEAQEILNQLAELADEYEEMMIELEDGLEELELAIGEKEEELDIAKYKEYMATMTTAPPPTIQPSYSGSGASGVGGDTVIDTSGITWLVPCSYSYVSSAFGWRTHPVYGDRRHHNGVDLVASYDTPIYATRSGVVVAATYSSSGGWYVTIDHLDGFKSTYMHMCRQPSVSYGDVVSAGQYLGGVGSTGVSTGNHLHFGIYYNGAAVNPMDYIG